MKYSKTLNSVHDLHSYAMGREPWFSNKIQFVAEYSAEFLASARSICSFSFLEIMHCRSSRGGHALKVELTELSNKIEPIFRGPAVLLNAVGMESHINFRQLQ